MKTLILQPIERFILQQAMLDPEQRNTIAQMRLLNKVLDVLDFSEGDIAACGHQEVTIRPGQTGVMFHEPDFMFELKFPDVVFKFMYDRAQVHNNWPVQSSRVVESLFDELEEAKRGDAEKD